MPIISLPGEAQPISFPDSMTKEEINAIIYKRRPDLAPKESQQAPSAPVQPTPAKQAPMPAAASEPAPAQEPGITDKIVNFLFAPAREPVNPAGVVVNEMQKPVLDGMTGARAPRYDTSAEAAAKGIRNTPENLAIAGLGVAQAVGEQQEQNQKKIIGDMAKAHNVTPNQFVLSVWAKNNGLVRKDASVSDALKELAASNNIATKFEDPRDAYRVVDLAAGGPTGTSLPLGTQLDAILKNTQDEIFGNEPITLAEGARGAIAEQKAQREEVIAPQGSMPYYVGAGTESLATMLPTLVAYRFSPRAGLGMLAEQTAGLGYVEARQEGATPDKAAVVAALNVAAEVVPEKMVLDELLKPANAGMKVLTGAGMEGVQEIFTEAINIGIDIGLLNKDMTWEEAKTRLADAGIIGTGVGTAMGAGSATMDYAGQQIAGGKSRQFATALDQEVHNATMRGAEAQAYQQFFEPGQPAQQTPAPTAQPQAPQATSQAPGPRPMVDLVNEELAKIQPITASQPVQMPSGPYAPTLAPAQQATTPPPAPRPAPWTDISGPEQATESQTDATPVFVDVDSLALSEDVPQFKSGSNKKGVVEPLAGKFDPTGVGPIQVWRRNDGRLEVISGRHRLDLAQRSGTKQILAQIHDEAQGFTADSAAALDAILNIRDNQGKVKDYVQFITSTGITKDEAEQQGLLGRALGKQAWVIADNGSPALVTAHSNDIITDKAAYEIARIAPRNESLQAVGLKALQEGKSIETATNLMQAVSALGGGATTGDMFGFDDSAMQQALAMAKEATRRQREIQQRISAISGASKNPQLAKAEGIDVHDPEALQERARQLRAEKERWDTWATDPELAAELRRAVSGQQGDERERVVGTAPQDTPPQPIEEQGRQDDQTFDIFGGQGADEGEPQPLLATQTEEELAAKDSPEEKARIKAAEEKEQAQREAEFFGLTPSEGEAGITAKQNTLFQKAARYLTGKKKSGGEQMDLLAPENLPKEPEAAKAQLKDVLTTEYMPTEVGKINIGIDTVLTPEDAAHVFAPFRKHAQETFMILVTDANGRILNLIRHTKGQYNQASVTPAVVTAAAMATPGAVNVWISHNHPSGTLEASRADADITAIIRKMSEAAGLNYAGHIIVVGGKSQAYYWLKSPYSDGEIVNIRPGYRKKPIGLTERILKRVKKTPAITSADAARTQLEKYEMENGLVFVNAAYEPVGTMALTKEEMEQLKKNEMPARVLRIVDRANSPVVFIKTSTGVGEPVAAMRGATENLYSMLEDLGIQVLDVINFGKTAKSVVTHSYASQGWAGLTNRVWMSKKKTKEQKALEEAQRNAAKPVSEGGLGLPPDNTAMDRAAILFPLDYYHGTQRIDRLTEAGKFDKKRSTSGPMPYGADSPDIASNYAKNKPDTSMADDELGNDMYYQVSLKDLGKPGRGMLSVEKSWWYLPAEKRKEILGKIHRIGYQDPYSATGPIILHPEGVDASLNGDHLDYLLETEAKRNPLTALRLMWMDSGELWGEPEKMTELFKLAGYPYPISETAAPWYVMPGVFVGRVGMKNPLIANDHKTLLEKVIPALELAFKKDRTRKDAYGADPWDKRVRFTPKEWVEELKKDALDGNNSFVWTSIPDKVTKALEELGYDGILDTGNKMGGNEDYRVVIPFHPRQVRSRFAAFDPAKKDSDNFMASLVKSNEIIRMKPWSVSEKRAREILEKKFSKAWVRYLESNGILHFVNSHKEFPPEAQAWGADRSTNGITTPDGIVYLNVNNITESEVVGLFLHEYGMHATMQDMLGDRYDKLVEAFDRLLSEGNVFAKKAKARAEAAGTDKEGMAEEQLAYLIEEVSESIHGIEGTVGLSKARLLAKTVVSTIRAWFWRFGVPVKLTERDIYTLAHISARSKSRAARMADAEALAMGARFSKQAMPDGERAHKIAQRNAAKPVSEGGLGLPPNNTAKDRARAMGYDVSRPLYHGTSFTDLDRFLTLDSAAGGHGPGALKLFREKYAKNESVGWALFRNGVFFSPDPKIASGYTGEKGAVFPVYAKIKNPLVLDFVRGRHKVANEPSDATPIDALYILDGVSKEVAEVAILDPNQVRSVNAAFDPMEDSERNIMASKRVTDEPEESGSLLLSRSGPGVNYVPTFSSRGLPPRPATGVIRLGGRIIKLPKTDKPMRREAVMVQAKRIIGMKIYTGNVRGKGTLGYYRRENNEIRTRGYDDIEVAIHEIAHWLDFAEENNGAFTTLRKRSRHKQEMKALSYTTSPSLVSSEGFAEFVRLWATDYMTVLRLAPGFTADFEALLAKNPSLNRQMRRLQTLAHIWYHQGPEATGAAKIGHSLSARDKVTMAMIRNTFSRARQRLVDGILAARLIEERLFGTMKDAVFSPFKQLQLLNGAEGIMQESYYKGAPTYNAGGDIRFVGPSLNDIWGDSVKKGVVSRQDHYFAARRAAELLSQGRENLFWPSEIQAGLDLANEYPWFEEAFDRYQEYNNNMLAFYVASGLITEDTKKTFQENNKAYVPFNRVVQQVGGGERGATGRFYRLTGGTRNIKPVFDNIVMTDGIRIREALKARAKAMMYEAILTEQNGSEFATYIPKTAKPVKVLQQAMIDKIMNLAHEYDLVPENLPIHLANSPGRPSDRLQPSDVLQYLEDHPDELTFWLFGQQPNVVDSMLDSFIALDTIMIAGKVIEKGETVYMEIQPDNWLMADMIDGLRGIAPLKGFWGYPYATAQRIKQFQTVTITSMLQFLGPNIIRDQIQAFVLTGGEYKPVLDALKGFYYMAESKWKPDNLFHQMKAQGGPGGGRVETLLRESRVDGRIYYKPRAPWNTPTGFLPAMLEAYISMADAFEVATRVGWYAKQKAKGVSDREAAWQAREISTDFAKHGNDRTVELFKRLVPFMGAFIQSNDREARAFANGGPRVFMALASVVGFAMLVAMLNRDDERYRALTSDQKARKFHIYYGPGATDKVEVPRPHGLIAVGASMGESLVDWINGHYEREVADDLLYSILYQIQPNVTPGALDPFIELGLNRDFTGAPIIPENMKDREPYLQFYPDRTAEIYIRIGKALNISPLHAQALSRGYANYVAEMAEEATQAWLWNEKEWGERPFVRTPKQIFLKQIIPTREPYRTKYTEGYYELKDRVAIAQGSFDALAVMTGTRDKEGSKLSGWVSDLQGKNEAALLGLNKTIVKLDSAMSSINKAIAIIMYDKTLTRAEKEQKINDLYKVKNKALSTLYKSAEETLAGAERDLQKAAILKTKTER